MQKYIYQWKNLNVALSMSDHLWIFLKVFEVIKDVNQVEASPFVSGQLRYNSEKKLRILTSDAQKEFKFDRRRRHR